MNTIDLQGKHAVVTGGARGIGLAIAERLLASGAGVSLWDRDGEAAAAAAKQLSAQGRTHHTTVDITLPESVQAAAEATLRHFGGVQLLVNNAGIAGVTKPTWECSPSEWLHSLHTNLFGAFLCCRALVPHMLEHRYGRIVNIASIAGKEGNPNLSAYSASKGAVIAFTKSLGKELATKGVIVNAIAPAVIESEMSRGVSKETFDYMVSRIPMGRLGRAEEVAELVAWLSSDAVSFSTAQCYDISGGRATY
jgi:3-oxoacyl-[acyl-carrier protein] reductase